VNEQPYTLTKLSLSEFTSELDTIWSELQDPKSYLSQKAATKGIDLTALRGLKRDEAIRIERQAGGLDVTAIVMAFVAHGVVEAVKAAWIHVILPRIKEDLGEDAIKKE
jgi:hypothetical protein